MNETHSIYQSYERIGTYQLQRQIGQSDLSEVYIAEHIYDQTLVALKLLYGEWVGEEEQKFISHAATLMQLQHPHIMPVLDYGIAEGIAFMAMRYAPGGTLRHKHPKGTRVSLEKILVYVKQVASALQFVHEQGLVHRDLKPHNLLLNEHNDLWLSDFGTAIISHSINPIHASQREFEGTVPYAAPEQLRGKPRRSSDQYALGIMIYEWLTGNWPFDGNFHEITHQHLFVAPPPLHERDIFCPENIERVLFRALEKNATNRFPSIKHFAEELEWAYKIAQARGHLPPPETPIPPALTTEPVKESAPQLKSQFKSPLPFIKREA